MVMRCARRGWVVGWRRRKESSNCKTLPAAEIVWGGTCLRPATPARLAQHPSWKAMAMQGAQPRAVKVKCCRACTPQTCLSAGQGLPRGPDASRCTLPQAPKTLGLHKDGEPPVRPLPCCLTEHDHFHSVSCAAGACLPLPQAIAASAAALQTSGWVDSPK